MFFFLIWLTGSSPILLTVTPPLHLPWRMEKRLSYSIGVAQICFHNLDFRGPVTATTTTKEKKPQPLIGSLTCHSTWTRHLIGHWLCTPALSVKRSHMPLPGLICRGNATLHQRWLIINRQFLHLGIALWKTRRYLARKEGGEPVVVVASSVSTLVALRTACSLRALTCPHCVS